MILPKPVWEDIMRSSHKRVIEWIFSDVPENWSSWSIKDRRIWRRDPTVRKTFIKLGHTCKRDRISAVEIWCEFYGYGQEDFMPRYARAINGMLENIPALERADGAMRCGPYGLQRGFYIH